MHSLVLQPDGSKKWSGRQHGKLHRVDGPSIVYRNGTNLWHYHGKLHRLNGPAIENLIEGNFKWYHHGKLHRDDGPAVILKNGTKMWYQHGNLHRDDGPAVECPNGTVVYWINGVKLTGIELFVKFGVVNE